MNLVAAATGAVERLPLPDALTRAGIAMLVERTGRSLQDMAAQLRGLVVTQGAEGCTVYETGTCVQVAGLEASASVDPTGCGDAFRGGLLWALEQGWSLADACKLGNVMGACKIACAGPQNYTITRDAALERLRLAYGAIPARQGA